MYRYISSIAQSAADAQERNTKNIHDKLNYMRSLQNSENDLLACQLEVRRLKDELNEERQKLKSTYLEKLTTERKSSELIAAKSRIEVS